MHSGSCTSCLDRMSSQPTLLSPMISNTCFAEGRVGKARTKKTHHSKHREDQRRKQDQGQHKADRNGKGTQMQKRRLQTKVKTTTNARQSSRGSPGTKPLGQGCFSRTGGCEACSGRPFISLRGCGTGFYNAVCTIGGSGGVSSRTFEGQGGFVASPRALLEHLGGSKGSRQLLLSAGTSNGEARGYQVDQKGSKDILYDSTLFSCQIGSGSAPDRARIVSIFPLFSPNRLQIYY